MREAFGKLKISTFYPLYKKFRIWNNEVSVLRINVLLCSMTVCM